MNEFETPSCKINFVSGHIELHSGYQASDLHSSLKKSIVSQKKYNAKRAIQESLYAYVSYKFVNMGHFVDIFLKLPQKISK